MTAFTLMSWPDDWWNEDGGVKDGLFDVVQDLDGSIRFIPWTCFA